MTKVVKDKVVVLWNIFAMVLNKGIY